MRTVVLVACLMMLAAPSRAHEVGVYSDLTTFCRIESPLLGFIESYFVIVRPSSAVTAAAYRIQPVPGLLYVAGHDLSCPGICEPPSDPSQGAYTLPRECSTSDWPVFQFDYLYFGTPSACTTTSVTGHPDLPGWGPVVYDCDHNPIPATGGTLTIGPPGSCGTCTLATESTTWGAVKALYR